MTVLRTKKTYLLLSFLCVLLLCLFNVWLRGFQVLTAMTPFAIYYSSSSSSNNRNVTVLLWYRPFNRPMSQEIDVCSDLYGMPRCKLVDQQSLFPLADVVVFHNRELIESQQKLPLNLPRPQGQRWAWMSMESPAYNGNLQQYASIFNMTISYRRDADITVPYGELLPKEAGGHLEEDVPLNKSTLACWVVSDFQNYQKRSQVYKELNAVVPVKVYGKWSGTPLSNEALLPTISQCYFYLAFENSVAKDYITEKLWRNAYQSGAVPVVLGPPISDYKVVAPPNSFIHVDEFASVRDLGKFLQELAEDKKRYAGYFSWKQQWKVKMYTDWRESMCQICVQYNNLSQHKVYSDLEAWDKDNTYKASIGKL